MSETMSQVPKDHPMMIAWEAYKATDDYANTRKWALYEKHVDGSLWAAFIEGYRHGWIPARPMSRPGLNLIWRIRLAWAVFTGRADALGWQDEALK